jgi:hypothetical protein
MPMEQRLIIVTLLFKIKKVMQKSRTDLDFTYGNA